MISLIICSRNNNIKGLLKENIDETIGVEYELIVIDNSHKNYSLFSAYNVGVKKAMFPYLCFIHDDIYFHVEKWGERVISHFKGNSKVGILGVAGSHYMPKTPSGWYQPHVTSGGCIQGFFKDDNYYTEKRIDLHRFAGKTSIEAIAVDGMWFCIPKHLFSQISFDEKNFNGFHCYDLDICFQIRSIGYQVRILSDIVIEHSSYGNFSSEWVVNTNLLFEKWKDKLPMVAGVVMSSDEMKIREEMVSETFLYISAYAKTLKELEMVRNSFSYRWGKLLIKPFSKIKKLLIGIK